MRRTPLLLLLLWPLQAQAQPPVESPLVRLQLDDASGCLDERALRTDLEARLARPLFTTDAPRGHLQIQVSSGPPWTTSLVLRRVDGTAVGSRTLDFSPPCSTLQEGVTLVASLILDVPPSQLPPSPPPVPGHAVRVQIDARALASLGLFPQPALGAGVAAGLATGRWRVALLGHLWPSVAQRWPDQRGASFRSWGLGAEGCLTLWSTSSLSLGPCVQALTGLWSARGEGFGTDLEASTAHLELALLPQAELRLGDTWSLTLAAGPVLSPLAPRLVADDGAHRTTRFEGSRLTGRAQSGVRVSF